MGQEGLLVLAWGGEEPPHFLPHPSHFSSPSFLFLSCPSSLNLVPPVNLQCWSGCSHILPRGLLSGCAHCLPLRCSPSLRCLFSFFHFGPFAPHTFLEFSCFSSIRFSVPEPAVSLLLLPPVHTTPSQKMLFPLTWTGKGTFWTSEVYRPLTTTIPSWGGSSIDWASAKNV